VLAFVSGAAAAVMPPASMAIFKQLVDASQLQQARTQTCSSRLRTSAGSPSATVRIARTGSSDSSISVRRPPRRTMSVPPWSRESEVVEVKARGIHAAHQHLLAAHRSGRLPDPSRHPHMRMLFRANVWPQHERTTCHRDSSPGVRRK
jgi:hypothetical protein